jgi:CRISPR-associated protein Cas1
MILWSLTGPMLILIVLKILDNGENFLELGNSIKSQLLGIATVDVQFEKSRSPLMVGIQNTTASLARCYEGKNRKINYPIMKDFNSKRGVIYKIKDDELTIAAEEEMDYKKVSEDEE